MSSMSSMGAGLYAALRLARGRVDAMALVHGNRTETSRSFWAILFCVPSVICRLLISWAENGVPAHAGHLAAQELMTFIVGWLVFVEISYRIAPLLGQAERWGRYIALWNWCNVVEGLLVVIGAIPGLFGAPSIVDQACELIMIGWALWLEWFATRLGLGVSGYSAAWLVILDQSIGITLAALASILMQ